MAENENILAGGNTGADSIDTGSAPLADLGRNSDGVEIVDPGEASKRARKPRSDSGKPRGPRTGTPAARVHTQKSQLTVDSIEMLLLTIHTGIAGMIHQPEFALSPEEAGKYSTAIKQFQEAFPVTRISPQMAACVNLGAVSFSIYAPRLAALKIIADMKRAQRPAPAPKVAPLVNGHDTGDIPFTIPPLQAN